MDKGAQKRRQSALKINLKSTDGLYMTTVNPCNDFLVDFLIASKLKSEKQGIGKFTTYNLAIQSVRKYPLPLICEAQLAALEGFGDFFINEAAKRIQKHYKRGRLPTALQIQQDDQQHFLALQANRRKGYRKKKANEQDQQQQSNQQNDSEQSQKQQKKSEKAKSVASSQKKGSTAAQTSSTSQSKKSRTVQNYKPRPDTEPEKIMMAMFYLKAKQKSVSKGQINQLFFEWAKESVKSWEFCRGRLRQSGYILFDQKQPDMIRLTQKGYNFIAKRVNKQGYVNGDLAQSQSQQIQKNQKTDNKKSSSKFTYGRSKIKECQDSQQLIILVNNSKIRVHERNSSERKSRLSEQQKSITLQMLKKQSHHKMVFDELLMGSFLWEIQDQIIDFAVIRVVIDPENFSEDRLVTRYCALKICEFTNIVVIIQKPQQQQNEDSSEQDQQQQQQKVYPQIQNFLMQCRAAGMNIIRFVNYQQTLDYISQITKLIKSKLKKLKQQHNAIYSLGSIRDITKNLKNKTLMATFYLNWLKQILILRPTQNENEQIIKILALKFGTFKRTIEKIQTVSIDDSMENRAKVVHNIIKKKQLSLSQQNISNFIRFLFADCYL